MSLHDETFRLLGVTPSKSASAVNELDDVERRLSVTLPPSIRDWYERDSAIRILAEHSNDDPPVEVRDFEPFRWQSRTLLPIRYENQGVCTWVVDLDGTEDPQVFVDVDSEGKEWCLHAQSFSKYVYSCVWDYKMVHQQPAVVAAQNCELTEAAIGELTKRFKAELITHGWPGRTQHRFQRSNQTILIWTTEGQADWNIAAANAASLRSALESIWKIDSVGDSLYDITDIGKDVLAGIRRRPDFRP